MMEFNLEVKLINLMENLMQVFPYLGIINFNKLELIKVKILEYFLLDKYITISYENVINKEISKINLSLDSINKFGISKVPGSVNPQRSIGLFISEELAKEEFRRYQIERKPSFPFNI